MSQHPELPAEQAYFDTAKAHRERAREKMASVSSTDATSDEGTSKLLDYMRALRLHRLGPPQAPVAFGRMDDTEAARTYIGRSFIPDEAFDPVVISWKARAAAPFYQATAEDHLGLALRRVFDVDDNVVRRITDIEFDDDSTHVPWAAHAHDTLLADLERRRDERLHDVVTTIQRDQDRAMRQPADQVLVIQGGPGTGKTIIGLQRVSFLLFNDSRLQEAGMLVVGPNPSFIKYIQHVLPELGDEEVIQLPIQALGPRARVGPADPFEVQRVKGDGRMAEMLGRAVDQRRTPPSARYEWRMNGRRLGLPAETVAGEMVAVAATGVPHNAGRDMLRRRLARLIKDGLKARSGVPGSATEGPDLTAISASLGSLLESVWPRLNPVMVLRDLLGSRRRLAEAGSGLFEDGDLNLLVRKRAGKVSEELWAPSDVPLLDELARLTDGGPPQHYAHIIIDEAQDLSLMQLRSLASRSRGGEFTILGDLAQATGPWSHESWQSIVDGLGSALPSRIVELKMGYRVPSQIAGLAARLFDGIAMPTEPPTAYRHGPEDPRFVQVASGADIGRLVADESDRMLGRGLKVGVLTAESDVERIGAALSEMDLPWLDGRISVAGELTLMPAHASRGLEFDGVVLVGPSDILEEGARGRNVLYVATTRSTRALTVVHQTPLPAGWAGAKADTYAPHRQLAGH